MSELSPDLVINLMNERTFYEFSRNLEELEHRLCITESYAEISFNANPSGKGRRQCLVHPGV